MSLLPAQLYSCSGTAPECCLTLINDLHQNVERNHTFPLSNASRPAETRVPAMSADQSSTGKLVVPVRAWAACSARAVSILWCAVSIAGIGELCSAVSRRMCEASLTPPSMEKPTVPSNLLCSILSPYESHLRSVARMCEGDKKKRKEKLNQLVRSNFYCTDRGAGTNSTKGCLQRIEASRPCLRASPLIYS